MLRFYFFVTKEKFYVSDFSSNWFSTSVRTSSFFDPTVDTSVEDNPFLIAKINYKSS